MANRLTQVIMKNIVEKCTDYKGQNTANGMHINNKEMDMIKEIIHRGNINNPQIKGIKGAREQGNTKYLTLDEFIGKSADKKEEENKAGNKGVNKAYGNGIKKVSLDDIVPKVSLASIGKKK